jgi:hypothetical protein
MRYEFHVSWSAPEQTYLPQNSARQCLPWNPAEVQAPALGSDSVSCYGGFLLPAIIGAEYELQAVFYYRCAPAPGWAGSPASHGRNARARAAAAQLPAATADCWR